MLSKKFPFKPSYKKKLFQLARSFSNVAWLDSNSAKEQYGTEDLLIGLGKKSELKVDAGQAFEALTDYLQDQKWAFGYFSYDLKNELKTSFSSKNKDGLAFPDLYFFEPELIVRIQGKEVELMSENASLLDRFSKDLNGEELTDKPQVKSTKPFIGSRLSKSEYLEKVRLIKQRIKKGDIYELNFCHEFFAEDVTLDAFSLYEELVAHSPTPFSSFLKTGDRYVLCASPERFLKKSGSTVLTQPIKGTIKRGATVQEDEQLKKQLFQDPKERSENVMIVDLVRNDLSRIAQDGSVKVDELFGIYTFSQVHQMISTVSCQVDSKLSSVDIIQQCFPMGSMTGAPKMKAIELIEQYEETKRSVFSGSIGYFKPNGDFDFNVVIRSLFYNTQKAYLSFSVGGAITDQSIPEKEYEETLLKAQSLLAILT